MDVTHATDYPTVNKQQHGDVRIGKGPAMDRGGAANIGSGDTHIEPITTSISLIIAQGLIRSKRNARSLG